MKNTRGGNTSNLRDKYLDALDVQECIEGTSANIALFRAVLVHCETVSDWHAMTQTTSHRYGVLSYQVHKFYYPSNLLLGVRHSIFGNKD